MFDQSLAPRSAGVAGEVRAPFRTPSKSTSCTVAPPNRPSVFQSIASAVPGPSTRAIGIQLAGSGAGNGAPLQNFFAGARPSEPASVPGATGANHAVRYGRTAIDPSESSVSSSGLAAPPE